MTKQTMWCYLMGLRIPARYKCPAKEYARATVIFEGCEQMEAHGRLCFDIKTSLQNAAISCKYGLGHS